MTMAAGVISLLKRYTDSGSPSPPFSTLILGSGVVFLGQNCRAPAHGKGSQCLCGTRGFRGQGQSFTWRKTPQRDRHSHHHHPDRECGEDQECASTNLPRKPRGARRRRAGIQPSIPEKLCGWPTVPAPAPTPHRRVQVPVATRRMLFSSLTTRGRAATCRNQSESHADQERILSGTLASLVGPPTTCHTRPRLISLKAVNHLNP